LCLVSADVTYFSPIFANGELAGRFISVAYVVAYMLFGAGALHPSMRRLLVRSPSAEEAAPRRLLVLPACPRCRCRQRSCSTELWKDAWTSSS
jgi:hypothetical protein